MSRYRVNVEAIGAIPPGSPFAPAARAGRDTMGRAITRQERAAKRGRYALAAYRRQYGGNTDTQDAFLLMVDLMHAVEAAGLNPDGVLLKVSARFAEERR